MVGVVSIMCAHSSTPKSLDLFMELTVPGLCYSYAYPSVSYLVKGIVCCKWFWLQFRQRLELRKESMTLQWVKGWMGIISFTLTSGCNLGYPCRGACNRDTGYPKLVVPVLAGNWPMSVWGKVDGSLCGCR